MNIKSEEVKVLSELHTAACAHVGDYKQTCGAFEKLAAWAMPKGLMTDQSVMLAIYHDDPELVAVEQLRSDACLVVSPSTVIEGDVRPYQVSGGKYLVINAELKMSEFMDVWSKAYQILKEKELECDNRDHYEVYLNSPEMSPEALFLIDICIPLK